MIKRVLLFLFLFLFITTGLFFFNRHRIAEITARTILQRSGLEHVDLVVTTIGHQTTQLKHFSAQLPHAAETISFKLADLRMSYDLQGIQQRQVNTITIDTLDITLEQNDQTASIPRKKTAFHPKILLDILERIHKTTIPLRQLKINQLRLHGALAGPFSGRPLSFIFNNTPQQLEATLVNQTPSAKPFQLTASLQKVGHAAINLLYGDPAPTPLLATAMLDQQMLTAHLQLQLAQLGKSIGPLPTFLSPMEGIFSLDMAYDLGQEAAGPLQLIAKGNEVRMPGFSADEIHLALVLKDPFINEKISLESPSHLQLRNTNLGQLQTGTIDLDLNGKLTAKNKAITFSFTPKRKWLFKDISRENLTLAQLQVTPPLSISYQQGTITITNGSALQMEVQQLAIGETQLPGLTIMPTEDNNTISIANNAPDGLEVKTGTWQTDKFKAINKRITMQSSPLKLYLPRLNLKNSQYQVQLNTTADSLSLTTGDKQIPLADITFAAQLDNKNVVGNFSCSPQNDSGNITANFTHLSAQGQGQLNLQTQTPLVFNDTTSTLAALLHGHGLPIKLHGGSLNLTAQANWAKDRPLQMMAQAALTGGSGSIKTYPFSGLEIHHQAQILPHIKSVTPGSIRLEQLDTPIRFKAIGMQLKSRPSPHGALPVLTIKQLHSNIFDGSLSTDELHYDLNTKKGAWTLQLQDIDLPHIITVQQIKGLEVSGKVGGTLPLQLKNKGLAITGGKLVSNSGGGTIRFRPSTNTLGQSQLTAYTLKALEEFHYNLLKASVDFTPDGTLQVNMHLQGKSPGLGTERPVHLNINTEQNLLSLLESLQYSKSITDEVDQKVQKYYNTLPVN